MAVRAAALLLAAGSSRRMGTIKQLLPLGDKPVIRHCVDTILAAGIRDLVVVVGASGEQVADALHDTPAMIVPNDLPHSQMADSVRFGLNALNDRFTGVLVCLSDHPLISAATYETIRRLHRETPGSIIIPIYQGRRGHPALFPLKALQEIRTGATLRDIIQKDAARVRLIETEDEGTVLDMDTEDEYQRIVGLFAEKNAGPSGRIYAYPGMTNVPQQVRRNSKFKSIDGGEEH